MQHEQLKLYVKNCELLQGCPSVRLCQYEQVKEQLDMTYAVATTVPARGKALVQTDLAIKVPKGTYGRVAPRSGLAWKNAIDVGAGVIDEDYRGNVGVILFNHSDTPFEVKPGDRIAQLVLEKIAMATVAEVDDLEQTDRGTSGFGSTGL